MVFDRSALPGRPVLVVTDTDHRVVADERIGVEFEVGRHGVVEAVAGALGPFDEAPGVREPTGRTDGRGIVVLGAVALEDGAVGVGFLAPADRTGLAIVAVDLGAGQDPASERASMRDGVAAGVEAAASPRVVGVPRVGVEDVQRPWSSGIVRSPPHDEARVGNVAPGWCAVGGERDEVESGLPVVVDRELDRRRPTAPGRVGVGWRCDERALDIGGAPAHLARTSPPFDRDVEACGAGGDVECDRVAGPVTEPTGVALDVVMEGLVVGHPPNLPIADDITFALRFW